MSYQPSSTPAGASGAGWLHSWAWHHVRAAPVSRKLHSPKVGTGHVLLAICHTRYPEFLALLDQLEIDAEVLIRDLSALIND